MNKRKTTKKSKILTFFRKNKNGKIIIIAIVTFLIVLIVANGITKKNNENYNDIKIEKDKYVVYTKYSKKDKKYNKEIPYLNIVSSTATAINKDIELFVTDFINTDESIIKYEYEINGIILSLVVKVVDYDNRLGGPRVYFRTYNVNIDTLAAISNESLLAFYGIDEQNVSEIIKAKFQEHYSKEIELGFIEPRECNFDCYIKNRGFSDYLEGVNYYVKEGKLYAYKPFDFYSIYGEEDYFKEEDFEFLITKNPKTINN